MEKRDTNETIIALAVPNERVLVRTSIPKNIAKQLGLAPGVRVVTHLDKLASVWIATIRRVRLG